MPLRSRKYNIGVMPPLFWLPFKLGVAMGLAAVVSVLALILLAFFTSAGWLSLLVLIPPVGLYVVLFTAGKKREGGVEVAKTGAWLHELEKIMLLRKLEKKLAAKNGKEVK